MGLSTSSDKAVTRLGATLGKPSDCHLNCDNKFGDWIASWMRG